MQLPIATTVNDRILRMDKELNDVLWLIKENCDEEEFKRYRNAFAEVMGTMALDVLNVIHREHPDLRPPELRPLPPAGKAKSE